MYLAIVVFAAVISVVYSNYKGWYSFSEYLACFGAGWITGVLVHYAVERL
jgi:hypothetical protein